jgi:hypothetical protein
LLEDEIQLLTPMDTKPVSKPKVEISMEVMTLDSENHLSKLSSNISKSSSSKNKKEIRKKK